VHPSNNKVNIIDLNRQARLREAIELFFHAYRAFTAPPDRILEARGLGRVHHRILYFVARSPGTTVTALLGVLGVSKQALNGPLRQLVEAGLVGTAASSVDVLVALLDEAGLEHALALSQRLRAAGLNVETQLEARKLGKQLQYADKAGIRFVAIRGEDEAARGVVAVKDLQRGDQFEVADGDLPEALARARTFREGTLA